MSVAMAVGSCGWQHPGEPHGQNTVSQRGVLGKPSSLYPPFETRATALLNKLDSVKYKHETILFFLPLKALKKIKFYHLDETSG